MFILKRQDVDIKMMRHPKKDQQIPVLSYQGQTFRLLSMFTSAQEEDARALWRDLTDNRGKACVLLEEADRFSVWGKVRIDQTADTTASQRVASASEVNIKACLLILQVLYMDVEDLLGHKQAKQFETDIGQVFTEWHFPQTNTPQAIKTLLTVDPLAMPQLPPWQDHHLQRLLEETHRIGKDYFGNANFVMRALEPLEDLATSEQTQFRQWLQRSPAGKLWL
ncbi:Npun_F0813 family protein [Nodosilinea sp. P-1105]|uniref:Npun_F0813 family protein n=1 Tax=Nodosilinea sp. P-1105 TaxID=2546229 RepID=UPI00146CD481|nr:Npun_F0813 family protein [Nodosilinea sp. P-1105]NMF86516.1 hypothetical protein [Nodosilinea sp. P-1105]